MATVLAQSTPHIEVLYHYCCYWSIWADHEWTNTTQYFLPEPSLRLYSCLLGIDAFSCWIDSFLFPVCWE